MKRITLIACAFLIVWGLACIATGHLAPGVGSLFFALILWASWDDIERKDARWGAEEEALKVRFGESCDSLGDHDAHWWLKRSDMEHHWCRGRS